MPNSPDYDGAWKDALDAYFRGFMALFWPSLHPLIDWTHNPVFMDKELQQIVRSAKRGRVHVDKLVRVRLIGGPDVLVLIHTEVQARREASFPQRMFRYHIRLWEKYPRYPLVGLAVLTYCGDDHAFWNYSHEQWGCTLRFTFPVVNLEAWRPRVDELLLKAPHNPFAVVVLAQLEANATRPDAGRLMRKTELMRYLYLWKFSRKDVVQLFRIIDAMLTLPEQLELQFADVISQIEEEHQMTYVTSIERILLKRERQKGMLEGERKGQQAGAAEILTAQVARKFGQVPDWARVRIGHADEAMLTRWAMQVLDAQRIEDVFA